MIKKLFAEKDATIYSDYNTLNSGLDAILEISKNISLEYDSESSISRILIKFSDSEISESFNKIGTGSFKSYLKLYLADANELPHDITLEVFPLSQSWDVGTGRYRNIPYTTNGVSWTYRTYNTSSTWDTASFNNNSTASFNSMNPGGGVWFVSSSAAQSFGIYNEKDLSLDVSHICSMWNSQSIDNHGFIIKLSGSEFSLSNPFSLKYFSRDTNTIYPPVLEFRWDNSSYNASSSNILNHEDIILTLQNNKLEYYQNEITRFKLNVKEKYPSRTFTTSSLFISNKLLPSSSYYAIKDLDTDLYVIDFDYNFTKISSDNNNNYFDIDMNGLEPERYYEILIKSLFDDREYIFNDQYYFKVKK